MESEKYSDYFSLMPDVCSDTIPKKLKPRNKKEIVGAMIQEHSVDVCRALLNLKYAIVVSWFLYAACAIDHVSMPSFSFSNLPKIFTTVELTRLIRTPRGHAIVPVLSGCAY